MGFVGRIADSTRLSDWASDQAWVADRQRLHVAAICGPGGVGKSALAYHALTPEVLAFGHYLVLRITGGEHPDTRDVFSWVERLIGSATELRVRVPNAFSRTRRLLEYQRQLSSRLVDDLRRQKAAEATIDGAKLLYGLGRVGEKVIKKDLRGVLSKETGEDLKLILDAVTSGPARSAGRALTDLPRPAFRRFRHNRLATLADELVSDLEAILRNKRVPELHRLLLIVDDYEFLEPVVGSFLTEDLLPRLRTSTARDHRAEFPSLILIIGRDELTNTAGGIWQQPPLRDDLRGRQIVLEPLSLIEIEALCRARGRDGKRAEFVHQASQGYPWLAELVIDEMRPDGTIPAIVYTNFFERMSRFMTSEQRGWFKRLCFLDQINIEGIEALVELREDSGIRPKDILEWFRHEPSIRDTRSAKHTVWPFVRDRVLMSQWIDSPRQFAELAQKAGLKYDRVHGPAIGSSDRQTPYAQPHNSQ